MSAYPTLDYLDDLTWSAMNRAWRLDLDPVRDPELGQFYGRTARYSTVDPYASEDDIFVFHATAGMGYTVQSGSYHDPFLLRIYDDAGNAIAADDGSGAYGYDYAAFTAPYTGWFYINASWDQGYYDTYASVNVYESLAPATTRITGTAAHDTLYGTRTNDIVDGGAGIDTFVLEGRRDEYTVTLRAGTITVTDLVGYDGTDQLRNVERLSFDDGAFISYETQGFPAETYRLYQAAFDRTPDTGGLGYWIGQMGQGQALSSVANAFINSSEFKSLYGAAPTDAALLTALYANVLDRAPDASGFAYWLGALQRDAITTADLLVQFSESPENQAQVVGSLQAGYEFIVT